MTKTETTQATGIELVGRNGDAGLLLQSDLDAAAPYLRPSRAANTERAYRADLDAFTAWCASRSLSALPAEPGSLALYIVFLANRGGKASSIDRAVSAISMAHRNAGHASPRSDDRVQRVLANVRREIGAAQQGKAALPVKVLATAGAARDDLKGIRDRALLSLGFAGGFRRSELVSLDVADLSFGPEGLTVTLRRSKTDQAGRGRTVGIPFGGNPISCPVRTVRAWLDAAAITSGPVFRAVDRHERVSPARLGDRAVALVVKDAAQIAGLDPAAYAGHSLRRGLASAAAKAGKSERSIMRTTGHRSEKMVRKYITEASIFADNASAGIGL